MCLQDECNIEIFLSPDGYFVKVMTRDLEMKCKMCMARV